MWGIGSRKIINFLFQFHPSGDHPQGGKSGHRLKKYMNKKRLIILFILLIIAAGAIFLYQQTYKHWPWQNDMILLSPTPSDSANVSGTPKVKTQRDIIMEDVAQKIAQLSPEEPSLGGHWFVDRFWFVSGSDTDFYVEYEDGHSLDQILLKAEKTGAGFNYNLVGFFTAGESGWILQTGTDAQFGKNLDLYEYDAGQKTWLKKN
jgi:hypothetical protein